MGFDLKLPDDVIKSVSDLADLVGAATYIKTPVFPVRAGGEFRSTGVLTGGGDNGTTTAAAGYHVAGSSANTFQSRFGHDAAGSGTQHSITRSSGTSSSSSRSQQIPNNEWETILSFQKTELKKKEGIELGIDNIRSYLNKLTDKTYTTMFANILKEIADLFTASTDDTSEEHNTVAVMNRVALSIFNTASSNAFYSEIYARLFRDLMAQEQGSSFAVFRDLFERNLASFMSLFETIDYCDPKKNYDKFCDSNMRQEGKTNEVDELTENLYIMVKHSHAVLAAAAPAAAADADADAAESFKARVEQITEISKLKLKSKPSITNKTIFRHLDMLDEISGKAKK